MNAKCIGLLLAIPALMGFGLTSCSNEEPIFTQEESATKKVEVSLIAELGNLSRASLTFDEAKNLKFKWAEEDVIYAVNADNGKYLGKLTVAKVLEDPRNCEFKGTLNLPSLGSANLKFYYLGEKGKMEFDTETYLPKDIEVDYSAQTGTAAELDDYDLLKAEKAYKSTDNGKLGRLSFERHFSTAQFVLKYNNEELNLNGKTVMITAGEGTLYSKASLNYMSGEYKHFEGAISVTPSTNNFYLNLIPTESVQFKFTVDMGNGNVFEGVKGGKIVEDTYYSDNLNAIVVEMKHNDGSDDEHKFSLTYNANDGSNDTWTDNKDGIGFSYTYTLSDYGKIFDETNEGYDFVGWNTSADGTGESLNPGAEYTVTYPDGTATLYAQWKQKEYNWQFIWVDELSFGDNAVTYGKKMESGEAPKTLQSAFPTDLPTSKWYNNMVKDGYTFLGWEYNGKMVGKNGNTYKSSDIVANKGTETVTIDGKEYYPVYIYAKWKKAVYDLSVIAYNNDGTDNHSTDTTNGKSLPFTAPLENLNVPTRNGYTFVGWGMTPDATVTVETVTFTTPDPISVYAIWKKDASSGIITAPGAGGSDY